MKTKTISRRSKVLNELLQEAQEEEVILETLGGQRFILAPVDARWHGYELDESDDITQNPQLMEHLRDRRRENERIPLAAIKSDLGLN